MLDIAQDVDKIDENRNVGAVGLDWTGGKKESMPKIHL